MEFLEAQHLFMREKSSGVMIGLMIALSGLRQISIKFKYQWSKSTNIYLLFNPQPKKEYVLGSDPLTVKNALSELCKKFKFKSWFKIKLSPTFIYFVAKCLRIKIGPWERHCIENPHMVYQTVNPKSFGLEMGYPSFADVLNDFN